MEVSRSFARLCRKAGGREAKLCYVGHVTMENRHGLAVVGILSRATGTAERRAAMLAVRLKLTGGRLRQPRTRPRHGRSCGAASRPASRRK